MSLPPPITHSHRGADWTSFGLVLAIGSLIYGWIAAHAYTVSAFSDPMDYMFMADFYKKYLYGGAIDQAAQYYRSSRYPPIFPMLLGAFGAGSDEIHRACIISNVMAVLAGLAVWWWIRVERKDAWVAGFIALALFLYPSYFLLNLFPLSEPLAMALMACVFAVLATPTLGRSRLLVAGLLIGIAPLARTALLPLIPAFVLWLTIRRPVAWRHMLLPVAAAVAPIAVWMVYRSALKADSYMASLTPELIVAELGGWPDALWVQPTRMFAAWVDNWGVFANPLTASVSGFLALMSAIGCVYRLRANKIDAWFLAGYIAMILVWPYPDELGRFLIVVYPCLLLCCITAAAELTVFLHSRWPPLSPNAAIMGVAGAVLLATAPTAALYARRASLPVDAELLGDKREPVFFRAETDEDALFTAEVYGRIRLLAAAIADYVPPGQCVYAIPPQLVTLYGKVPALLYPKDLVGDPEAESKLPYCDFFFLGGVGATQLDLPALYPWQALTGWTEPVLTSEISRDGETSLAAALLKRSSRPDGAAPSTHEDTPH